MRKVRSFLKPLISRTGFNLVEILVTAVIIGILATIAMDRGAWILERSRSVEAKDVLYKGYAGYRRLVVEGELLGGGNPVNWTRLGMSDPNVDDRRFFNYTFWPNDINPSRIQATRRDNISRWLYVTLANGVIIKTVPY